MCLSELLSIGITVGMLRYAVEQLQVGFQLAAWLELGFS